jgi:ABC-type transport system involved in multi-copper enzyme maturation permease subunit
VNPILAREVRSRFRDKRSYWLLLGLSVLLCLAAAWAYRSSTYSIDRIILTKPFSTLSVFEQATMAGRDLFKAVAYSNVFIWLLVAPALTATGLCRERERGLLESLWLSPFSVKSQMRGRLFASLLFLAELQLVTLPIYGIALLLGGVSPFEVATVTVIVGLAALSGAALGLWCSARAYRPVNALANAMGIVTVGSTLLFGSFWLIGTMLQGLGFWYGWVLSEFIPTLHPYMLLNLLLSPNTSLYLPGGIQKEQLVTASLLAQFGLALLLLRGATHKASKPLPEVAWLGRNPIFEGWHRRLEARKQERLKRQEKARLGEKVGGALLYQLPFEKLVRFRNPLLRREVRARFRMRQGNFAMAIGRLVALFLIVSAWLMMISTLFDPSWREGVGRTLIIWIWALGVLVIAVLSSTAFTREQESGTWEGLQLSLLTIKEIVLSKWVSSLVTYAYWSLPLWMWVPFCARIGRFDGVAIFPLLGAVALVLASLCTTAALGLYVSSRTPNSAAATSWTLAVLLLGIVGAPLVAENLHFTSYFIGTPYYGPRNSDAATLLSAFYPQDALRTVLDHWNETEALSSYPYSYYHPRIEIKFMVWLMHMSMCAGLTMLFLDRTLKRAQKRET